MKTKVRRKMSWDDHGVSEIIADILILAMTVVLFAIIFAFVWSMPAPNEATYADIEGNIQLDATGGTIYMTHLSGEDLRDSYTEIYLYKNSGQEIRMLVTKDPSGDPDNPTGYGLEGDPTWSPGETWEYYMVGIDSNDELEIKIWDSQTRHLVHSQILIGAGMNDAPIIMERWYKPSPAVNASTVVFSANVMDPDGWGDIATNGSVYIDISPLNKTYSIANLNMISHTNFRGEFQSAPILIDKGEGTYTLTIYARDVTGLRDTNGRIVVNVGSTALNAPRILERWSIPVVGVNGTGITIYAKVEDQDGYANLDYVISDIGNLTTGSSNWVTMLDPEQDGIFEYSTPINVSIGDSYRVNFNVKDITNLEDNEHLNITVTRFKPVISRTWTVPTTGKDEEFITVYAEVSDPDGYSDILEVLVNLTELNPALGWVTMVDPEQDSIFISNLTIDVATGGNKTVDFIARDKEGNGVTGQMRVFVATKNPPVILERWTDPNFPDNGSQVTIYARVIDADGYDDIDFVRVNITTLDRNYNGSGWVEMIDPNQDGNFINITMVDQEAGSYMVEFLAQDKGGSQAFATLNLTVLPYRPRFLNVWTNPTIGRNGTGIQIFANVMDPNGYIDIAQVQVDIVELNESLNQSQPYWVNMTDYNQNGTFSYQMLINVNETGLYTLNFTVKDSDGNMATISHELIVTSYKPRIIQIWQSPSPAINGTNVTISAWVWDDDGPDDIASVIINVSLLNSNTTWTAMLDPNTDGVFTNKTLINALNASGTYNVTVTAVDTTGNSVTKNATIEVELTPPPSGDEDMVFFGDVTPNGVDSLGNVFFNAWTKNGTTPDKRISEVKFTLSWKAGVYDMDRLFDWLFKYPGSIQAPGTTTSNLEATVYFRAFNSTGAVIAYDNVTLLVLYDKSGGKVTEGTALEQNVAWIADDQGFVITNNKTNNEMIQIFDVSDPDDEHVWVKIGSNAITNTEKANIFRFTSRTTGETVAEFSSPTKQFAYDGVLAGYWFFVLDFSALDVFNWMQDELPGSPTSEYFDIYMKIKDTTDDFFATNSWIVVYNGTLGFYPEVELWFDPGYIPGGGTFIDGNSDGLDDTIIQVTDVLEQPFNNTDYVYIKIIAEDTDASVTFDNLEVQDFHGNQVVSGGEGNPTGAPPAQKIITNVGVDNNEYTIGINLVRADKDPWLFGENAYTIIIRGFRDTNEEYAYLAVQCKITSPASIMDIVIGHVAGKGSTNIDLLHGQFYENQGGFFDDYLYAWAASSPGQLDWVGDIYTVDFEDIDGDDDRDIICGRAGDGDPTFSIYWYYAPDHFEEQIIDSTLATDPYSVVAGEVDAGNDALDIVVGTTGGNIYLYLNDGYWSRSTITTGAGTVSMGHTIEIADLDDDGDGDVVVGSGSGLHIYRNRMNEGLSWVNAYNQNPGTVTSLTVDLISDDHYHEIVIGDADGDIWRYINTDSDLTTWTANKVADDINGANPVYLDVGNIDGVGYPDIVAGCDDEIEVWTTANGGFAWTQLIASVDTSWPNSVCTITGLEVGNVDGAIEDDIVVVTEAKSAGKPEDGGYTLLYRNLGRADGSIAAGDWLRFIVDNLIRYNTGGMKINCVAIGDADLGNA